MKWPRSGMLSLGDALKTEVKNRKCLFKKAYLALGFLSLMRGKDDKEKKSSDNINHYVHTKDFDINIEIQMQ
ncbi:hypothetical protein OA871_02105 [Paracoccaceae bacterium]|nr:hypothetical protein [Paracoccaceae bacterium]